MSPEVALVVAGGGGVVVVVGGGGGVVVVVGGGGVVVVVVGGGGVVVVVGGGGVVVVVVDGSVEVTVTVSVESPVFAGGVTAGVCEAVEDHELLSEHESSSSQSQPPSDESGSHSAGRVSRDCPLWRGWQHVAKNVVLCWFSQSRAKYLS
jgi:hypothetical protein